MVAASAESGLGLPRRTALNLTLSFNCSKLGVDDAAVLDVQNSVVTIGPPEVVVGDLHWSALEVHVQDVGIYVLLCLVLDNERVVCEDQACVEDLVPAADVLHHRHA